MATGYLNGRLESTPGNENNTPTLSTKTIYFPLITAQPTIGVQHLDRNDENRNSDEPLAVLTESKTPAWSYESRAYPDLLGFWLTNMLGEPTSTAGNGVITDPGLTAVPTGATRHVWTSPFGPSGAYPKTSQLQFSYADQSVFFKLKGCGVSAFSLTNPETGGTRVSVSGPALYLNRQANPSLTASYESLAVRPFTRRDLTLTWLTGGAEVEDFSIEGANPMDASHTIGSAKSQFYTLLEKGDSPIMWSGSIPKRQLDADDIDALLNATGFAALATWTSDSIIASSYPYKLFIEGSNAQYTGGDAGEMSNRRRIGASFDFMFTSAGSASTTITLVNATSSYV